MRSKESAHALKTSGEAALQSYHQLKTLDSSFAPLHEAAEGAAPHLIDHISRTTQHVRGQLRDAFSKELDAVLKKIDWPKRPETTFLGSLQEQWAAAAGKLLDLQKPELEAAENSATGPKGGKAPLVLLPMEVLVQPLEMRFRYHFEGDKPTNRLDKPEYFLSHIIDLLNNFNPFIVDNLQPILLSHFRGTDIGLNAAYIDATCAFITALLPMLRSKIFSTLPKVASQPQLLSHLMHEIMSFDTTLKEDWRYDGGNGAEGWKGLAWEVLVSQDWFGRWLQVEKDCKSINSFSRRVFSDSLFLFTFLVQIRAQNESKWEFLFSSELCRLFYSLPGVRANSSRLQNGESLVLKRQSSSVCLEILTIL